MKISKKSLTIIQKIVNEIKDNIIFKQALSHTSYCHEKNISNSNSYENLEFFGDSILNFQVSNFIFKKFPNFNEGQMSKLKQLMIKQSTLALLSEVIGLKEFLLLGTGEKKNKGEEKESILSDVFESFLASIFLIKGMSHVETILKHTLFLWIKGKENLLWDYKSKLQEYSQSIKKHVNYTLEKEPDEKSKNFIVTASIIDQDLISKGSGNSIKIAEQSAAKQLLKKIKNIKK